MLTVRVVQTADFEFLLCARYYSKSCTSTNSFTVHKSPMRPFPGSVRKMKKLKCTDSFNNSPQGTQLVNGSPRPSGSRAPPFNASLLLQHTSALLSVSEKEASQEPQLYSVPQDLILTSVLSMGVVPSSLSIFSLKDYV